MRLERKQENASRRERGANLLPISLSIALCLALQFLGTGCATVSKVFAADKAKDETRPINNPFGNYEASTRPGASENLVLRSKKGDRSLEVEMPSTGRSSGDVAIPVAPALREGASRSPASAASAAAPFPTGAAPDALPAGEATATPLDETYKERRPSMSDREIAMSMPQTLPENDFKRREVEQGMNLIPSDEPVQRDRSYLASVDHIKQLFRMSRYEAALLETDDLIREFQTDPKLYEMRGTLLDRLGKIDLAIRSWKQSLRFNPKNESLRRYVERREQIRGLASQ